MSDGDISTITHDATYVPDGDGNYVYPALIGGCPDWAQGIVIEKKSILVEACAAHRMVAGFDFGTLGENAMPGRIVHIFRIVRGGRVVYQSELYPYHNMDTFAPNFPLNAGDVIQIRGVTASIRTEFTITLTLTLVEGAHAGGSPIMCRTLKDRPYCLRTIVGNDVAAGLEAALLRVPPRGHWVLEVIQATLVTNDAAANRYADFWFSRPGLLGTACPLYGSTIIHAASLTKRYILSKSAVILIDQTTPYARVLLPLHDIELSGYSSIYTATTALQAGDNWGPIVAYVRERVSEGYYTESPV